MTLKIGDRVEVLDDVITGIVTRIDDENISIEDDNGFEYQFRLHEILKSPSTSDFKHNLKTTDFNSVKKNKSSKNLKLNSRVKPKQRHTPKLVLDLHIHQLIDSTKGMTSFDILNFQISTAKRQLEFALHKRIPKIVFIHGVGEGVLRLELETLLRRYENLDFYDADYKTYGFGATEVRIFQNQSP